VAHDGRHTNLLFKGLVLRVALFWLGFKADDISVYIQPADDIISARMRAMLANVPGTFQEGHELDAKTAKKAAEENDWPRAHSQSSRGAFEEVGLAALASLSRRFTSDGGPNSSANLFHLRLGSCYKIHHVLIIVIYVFKRLHTVHPVSDVFDS